MTAAQRATLEQMLSHMSGDLQCVYYASDAADALRAALGTCGNCAHIDEAETHAGYTYCAAPDDIVRFPFHHKSMPLGERCTGWTAKEGA